MCARNKLRNEQGGGGVAVHHKIGFYWIYYFDFNIAINGYKMKQATAIFAGGFQSYEKFAHKNLYIFFIWCFYDCIKLLNL